MERASWTTAMAALWLPWRRRNLREGGSELLTMRALALAFIQALLLILFVMQFIDFDTVEDSWAGWHLPVLVAASGFGLAGHSYVRHRTDRIASAPSAGSATEYFRNRMFLMFAFGEMPALVGFAVSFPVGSQTPYLITLPLALLLLIVAAPRDGDVRQVQRAIDEAGGTVNLSDALTGRV